MGYNIMISRALFLALTCACATALTPLSAVGDDNDCALYISGPGRTSAYDYSLNLLKGNFGYEGQHTCITYDAVNQAYLEARNRIAVSQPKGDWKPEDYASVGELVLDISINLARRYGLTYEEIEKGLPLIDTSRTLIRGVCPPVFSHVECRPGKYRRLDGLCNNLDHPTWGSTNAPFQRLIGPLFSDGINSPRIAHTGRDLPLSRVVSRTMHPDEGFHDHAGTVMVIAWGQFMDHDYTLTGTPLDPLNRNDPEECCNRPPHLKHPYCNEIRIPDDDYFYRLFGVKCIDFVRAFPSPRPGCRLGSRVPFNTLTGVLDGNTVYGVTEKFARKLRTGYGGLLRMNPVFKDYGLKDLLPLKLDIPDEGCTRPNKNMYCFEGGEIRVNEQLILTVMHTLMAREHNRVAEGLAAVNPHWDDETLYQEARRINIAEIQHITYNEFLPILLGKDVMQKFGLVLEKQGYWDGYDTNVNPDVIASFASAAYRFGHSLLPTAVERWSKAHKFIASKRLSDLIRRPYDLYRAGVLDEYVMGLMNQVAQAMDDSITQEVTNHLFKKVGARFGMDLVSFNMQRGREFGIPGYMEFRKFCGLSGADSFQDLFGTMANETVQKYETIFEHPIDVDLWSGGVSERPLPGSMLGPTFACIIATQFSYSRRGDRFWFELPNQPSSFTPEQLNEIRKSRMARIICDNTDIIDTVQLYPMVLPDHELNPRVPCKSGIIPQMDFSKWAEPVPFHGGAKQFITDAIIPIKNEDKNCDKLIDEEISITIENDNTTNKCDDVIVTAKQNTANNNIMKTQQIVAIEGSSNNTNCMKDCTETKTKSNKINDSVTTLKYVNKHNDLNIEKTNGHPKNSLKRKKRSLNIYTENARSAKSVPIVNFVNSHAPKDIELKERDTGNVIQGAALADFNIETLHENSHLKNKGKENQEDYRDDSREDNSDSKSQENSEDINNGYKDDDIRHDKPYNVNQDSGEIKENTVIDKFPQRSEENEESHERVNDKSVHNKEAPYSNSFTDRNERREIDKSDEFVHPNDSNERGEKYYDNKDRSAYTKPSDDSNESDENENFKEGEKSSYEERPTNPESSNNNFELNSHKSDSRPSFDDSNDSEEDTIIIMKKKNRKPLDNTRDDHTSTAVPIKIQDVDLRDFSYERIKVNDKGVVEPAKDVLDNYDEISPLTTTKPIKNLSNKNEQYALSTEESDSPLSSEINEGRDQPIHLNDGEVKPVIEIDRDSNESSEERSKEAILGDFPNEDSSLETFLGVKEIESQEQKFKIIASPKRAEKDDVKQEFERIPLNYQHDKKQKGPNSKDTSSTQNESTPKSDNDEETPNDGTLDTLRPPETRYDENLNIKFDDLTITLPEIKLPEDILAYTYEKPAHTKFSEDDDQDKTKLFHYSDESQDNSRDKKKSNENNNYHDNEHDNEDHDKDDPGYHYDYYGYPKKNEALENMKNQEDEDEEEEDEDLYEKFVRERFGKRSSFQKRSEKLQVRPVEENAKLYETLQKVLKKTEDIQNQADKSEDPNAGYMWTLEYGHNL